LRQQPFDCGGKTSFGVKVIDKNDLNLIYLAENAEQAVTHINEFYSRYLLKPNF